MMRKLFLILFKRREDRTVCFSSFSQT